MSKQNFRQQIKRIFDHFNKKTITKEEFLGYLQKQGYTREEAIEIYNQAAKEKIIETWFITELDEKGHTVSKKLFVEYMTEEDWEAIEAIDKEIAEREELKRILWEEWEGLTDEEREKKIKEILEQE
ncbi:MAG: hypothetical protein DRJ44_05180 [Thermoprotei archaeon]|nr:MAG: hypothetical protein DRJ44_05180 [Thermoprotei archaeon]